MSSELAERAVCIRIDRDRGSGIIIWSDPTTDPDLEELIIYLVEEHEITGEGTYLLLNLEEGEEEDTPIEVANLALYTISEDKKVGLVVEEGIPTPRYNVTSWPPKRS